MQELNKLYKIWLSPMSDVFINRIRSIALGSSNDHFEVRKTLVACFPNYFA